MTARHNTAMTATINGKPHPLPQTTPLPLLLAKLGLAGKPVVVELNEEALPASQHNQTCVQPGDRVEIITLAAGG